MLVDEYEQYHNDRTDDVVVSRSGSEEPEPEPLADDCKIVYHPSQMLYTFPHLFKMALDRYLGPRARVGCPRVNCLAPRSTQLVPRNDTMALY
jgi:hypothetical protein